MSKIEKESDMKSIVTNTACSLFANQGYHETTMEDIAKHAGCSKGGVYYYFGSKEEVLFEIHDRFIREGLRRLHYVATLYPSPEDRLHHLFDAHFDIIHEFKDDITLFFHANQFLHRDKYDKIKSKRNEYERYFLDAIHQGVEEGVFETSHAKTCTLFVLGAFNFMYVWYLPGGELGPGELKEVVRNLLMNGLKKRVCEEEK